MTLTPNVPPALDLSDPDHPDMTRLADWLEGRLSTDDARRVADAVEHADARLRARVCWLQSFLDCAQALPLHLPPALVRQRLRQHFDRWSKAREILERPVSRIRVALVFDSRMDRPLVGVRGVAEDEVVHLGYRGDTADLVLDLHPLPGDAVRIEGQVLPLGSDVEPIFEATASGPGLEVRTVDGDELGRFTLTPVPRTADRIQAGNGEMVLLADLDLRPI